MISMEGMDEDRRTLITLFLFTLFLMSGVSAALFFVQKEGLVDRYTTETASLKSHNERLEQQVARVVQEKDRLHKEIQSLYDEVETRSQEQAELRGQLELAVAQRPAGPAWEGKQIASAAAMPIIGPVIPTSDVSNPAMLGLMREKAALELEARNLRDELALKGKTLDELLEERKGWEQKLNDVRDSKRQLEGVLNRQQERARQLERELVDERAQRTALEQAGQESTSGHRQIKQELESRVSVLTDQNRQLESRVAQLTQELASGESEKSRLNQRIVEMGGTLKTKLAEVNEVRTILQEVVKETERSGATDSGIPEVTLEPITMQPRPDLDSSFGGPQPTGAERPTPLAPLVPQKNVAPQENVAQDFIQIPDLTPAGESDDRQRTSMQKRAARRAAEAVAHQTQSELAQGMGKILTINRKYDFVVVNMGADNGVTEGDVFQVVRDGRVIGEIQVTKARAHLSAAAIRQEEKRHPIKEGDLLRSAG